MTPTVETPNTECSTCHYPLDANYKGSCPKCGDTRKTVFFRASAPISVSATAKLSVWQIYIGYWTENRVWLVFNCCLTVILALLTLYIGYLGLFFGLIILITPSVALIGSIIHSNENFKQSFLSHFEYKKEKKN